MTKYIIKAFKQDELKKKDIRWELFDEEEKAVWDYAVKHEHMHVFRFDFDGYIMFFGDECDLGSCMHFFEIESILNQLGDWYRDKVYMEEE